MSDGKMQFCKKHGKFDSCATDKVEKAQGWPDNGIIHHTGTSARGLKGMDGRPTPDTAVMDSGNREFDGTPMRGKGEKGAGSLKPHLTGKHKGKSVKVGNQGGSFTDKVGDMHIKKNSTGHDAFLSGVSKAYQRTNGNKAAWAAGAGTAVAGGAVTGAGLGRAMTHQRGGKRLAAAGTAAMGAGLLGAAKAGAVNDQRAQSVAKSAFLEEVSKKGKTWPYEDSKHPKGEARMDMTLGTAAAAGGANELMNSKYSKNPFRGGHIKHSGKGAHNAGRLVRSKGAVAMGALGVGAGAGLAHMAHGELKAQRAAKKG